MRGNFTNGPGRQMKGDSSKESGRHMIDVFSNGPGRQKREMNSLMAGSVYKKKKKKKKKKRKTNNIASQSGWTKQRRSFETGG